MRIISGIAKGRRLKTPKTAAIRPTSDRVREALFNIIAGETAGAHALDLFAGTGALGIEALSRGAEEALFVDEGREALELVRENLKITGFEEKALVVKDKVEKAIGRLASKGLVFNLIFLDPPYKISVNLLSDLLERVGSELLANDGLAILEHSAKLIAPDVAGLTQTTTRRYGDTVITIYRREGASDDSDLSG